MFPETYPFDFNRIFDYNYFWLKYYISQRTFFALPKRPMYVNYEVLTNAFNCNVIDFSEAEIYELKNTEMSMEELEHVLTLTNEYSFEKFAVRWYQMHNLEKLEESIIKKEKAKTAEQRLLKKRLSKSFDEVASPKTPDTSSSRSTAATEEERELDIDVQKLN